MQDKELFRQLLGLTKPWIVSDIKIDFSQLRVDIAVEWPKDMEAPCPECGEPCKIYDHREERTWRHLDTMQFQTFIRCRMPRVRCKDHGVATINVPWSEKQSRFTLLFERFVIDVLLATQNQTKARELLRLSWDEVHNIQERAVERGLSRRRQETVSHVGVDEKGFLKGHSYATILYDLEKSRVLDVNKDRKEESLSELFGRMGQAQKASVEAVVVDMWEPYRLAVEKNLPHAQIVHDKFHIMKHLAEAVDKVRKMENGALAKEGIHLLKGTKYLWLTHPDRWTEQQKELFKELKTKELKVGRAWSMKEVFATLWEYSYEKSARKFFERWHWWATHSRLRPMADAAKMLKRHLENILSYLVYRITNAVAEGLNSKIQQVKSAARGFRNFENYRIAILFFCGKLDMYPQETR